jgi:hypothetical protein
MFSKIFTPQEANKRLPLIKKIVEDILEKGREFRSMLRGPQGKKPPEEALRVADEIEELMHELEALGCFYKDWNFEMGLVDFPALIGGQEVLLCWRSDEPDVRSYHGVDDGYAGRKAIPEELL